MVMIHWLRPLGFSFFDGVSGFVYRFVLRMIADKLQDFNMLSVYDLLEKYPTTICKIYFYNADRMGEEILENPSKSTSVTIDMNQI